MSITTPNGFQLDNSGKRVVVDPITRIEGHLRIEVNVDESNVIRNAVSTGTMWRGLEVILRGRDPRDAWAFVQRICGVCTGVHALASVRCVENALGIEIPENANTIRNIMHLTLYSQDHLVHFYHLHALDWVDGVSAVVLDGHDRFSLRDLPPTVGEFTRGSGGGQDKFGVACPNTRPRAERRDIDGLAPTRYRPPGSAPSPGRTGRSP